MLSHQLAPLFLRSAGKGHPALILPLNSMAEASSPACQKLCLFLLKKYLILKKNSFNRLDDIFLC